MDTIEHGGLLDDGLVELFKERHSALVSTITPTAIMACLPTEVSGLSQLYKDSCALYMEQIIPGFQRAVKEEIPIGLGIDDGSPYVTHYCMWRELDFFTRYIETSPEYALWRATEGNALIAGIVDMTGTITPGKASDLLVIDGDPRSDFSVLSKPYLVVRGAKEYRRPKCRRYPEIDRIVDRVKEFDGEYVAH